MNLHSSFKVASLIGLTLVGLISATSSNACPRAESRPPESAFQDPYRTGNGSVNLPRDDSNQQPFVAFSAEPFVSHSQAAIVGLLAIAGVSTAMLIYKIRLMQRKATAATANAHPALDHPELSLADLPWEAFPAELQRSEFPLQRGFALLR